MSCILAATDGSSSADRAVEFAARLAERLDLPLVLLAVAHETPHSADNLDPSLRARTEAERRSPADLHDSHTRDVLLKAKARAEAAGARRVQAVSRVMSATGDVPEAILAAGRQHDASVIVVGKRGRGRLTGLLLGSVSQKLVSAADRAVAVVP